MSEHEPKVPQNAEQPEASVESGQAGEAEAEFLRRLARSSTLRDVHERRQYVLAVEKRLGVLQGKLDKCETMLAYFRPRTAELEQASRVSKLLAKDSTIAVTLGGIFLSVANFFSDLPIRYSLAGVGAALLILDYVLSHRHSQNAWPPKSEPPPSTEAN